MTKRWPGTTGTTRTFGTLGAALLALAGLFGAPAARASCVALGIVTCSATVTASPLAFPSYNPSSGANDDVSSSLTVTAIAQGVGVLTTVGFTISLDAGLTGTIGTRLMTGGSGGPYLAYGIYTNTLRTQVWGNATVSDSLSVLATVLGSAVSRSYTTYGRVPPGQYVSFGSYSDTVTITVNY